MDRKEKAPQSPLKMSASPGMKNWLSDRSVSLIFTARKLNTVFALGVNPDNQLCLTERSMPGPSALAVDGHRIFVSGLSQIWQLNNLLQPGQHQDGYDRIYRPHAVFTTGDCAVRDLGIAGNGRLIFANTRFSCIAALSPDYSFSPLWKPDFISQLVPEDRCHLNGIVLTADKKLSHVTALARTDTNAGWKSNPGTSGLLIDVSTGNIIMEGLCLPHSPRLYRDDIWLLNSGLGQLGRIDLKTKTFNSLITCPGFPRGLEFIDHYAIVTVSKPHATKGFSGLPLEKALTERQLSAQCGIVIIDLEAGRIAHSLTFDTRVDELMDVRLIKKCRCPMLLGFKTDDTKQIFSLEPIQKPEKPGNPILV